jgi:hypothetical protein
MRSPLSNWFISTRKPKDNQALAYLPIWGELSLFPIMGNKKGYRISRHPFYPIPRGSHAFFLLFFF